MPPVPSELHLRVSGDPGPRQEKAERDASRLARPWLSHEHLQDFRVGRSEVRTRVQASGRVGPAV